MDNKNNIDLRCEELLNKIAELIRSQSPEKQKELLAKYSDTYRP